MFYYILFFAVLLCIYASLYFIYKDDIAIHQTNVNNFDFSLLYTKQPLIIEDSIADVNNLIDLWFKANIIDDVYVTNLWNRNAHKYLLVYASDNESEITLYHASKKLINNIPENDDSMITIKLKNRKILFIPYRWYYNITGNVQLYGIHDYITYVISKFL